MRWWIVAVVLLVVVVGVVNPHPRPNVRKVTSDPSGVVCTSASDVLMYGDAKYTCLANVYAEVVGAGSGDVTAVGDCASGNCYQTAPPTHVVAGPSGGTGPVETRALIDADVPDTITVSLAATATALAANGGNCNAGEVPSGVDASGAAESCDATPAITGTDFTGIPYTALANGTDGQLITWAADASVAVVAAGTAAQVLTSNGAGAPPTFQAAAGAAGGDSVSINGGAVVDPDFVSTGQVSFTDTANTITANITDASVVIGDIANGTDGELITWDAAGAAAAVAAGTATHVLTSNGAGAAPTFQAAAGGGGGQAMTDQTAAPSCNLGDIWIDDDGVVWVGSINADESCEWWVDFEANKYVTHEFMTGDATPTQLVSSGSFGTAIGDGRVVSKYTTAATIDAEAFVALATTSIGTIAWWDGDGFIEFRSGTTGHLAGSGSFRVAIGTMDFATSGNWLSINGGMYFWCAPGDDVDGDGTAGSANDLNWWTVTSDIDTDYTASICSTLTGVQCNAYAAVNTAATNTEIACSAVSPIYDLAIRMDPAGDEVRFYIDRALVATHTTYIHSGPGDRMWTLMGVGGETTTSAAVSFGFSYISLTINPDAY